MKILKSKSSEILYKPEDEGVGGTSIEGLLLVVREVLEGCVFREHNGL